MQLHLLETGVSGLDSETWITIVIAYFASTLIVLFMAKVVFQIPRIIKLQRVQCRLLSRIAKAHGVTKEEIDEMYKL